MEDNKLDEFPKLRKIDPPGTGRISDKEKMWSLDNLRDGLLYYFKLNGKYPTAHDIDLFEYLPSSRQIQRRFGGLAEMRKALGLGPEKYSSGQHRSEEAKKNDERARVYEEEYFTWLTSQVPEVRVHEQKVIRPQGIRCDYFIYTSDNKGIVVDLFFSKDIYSLRGILHIKRPKYVSCESEVFFVVMGEKLTQEEIDMCTANKKEKWPDNIHVLTDKNFRKEFQDKYTSMK